MPAEVPTPAPTPSCANANDVCQWVFHVTHNSLLASSSYWFLVKPVSILLIIVVAMIARFLLHRAINRLVRTTANGAVPTVLRPLKERLPGVGPRPAVPATSTALVPERRRQRAEAIGSVLRSSASAAIFTIAGLMILRELGFDLAPLLASAGIAGVALGFGAQTLVKDLIAGLFMLLEDQYGVGDVVDLGEASGTVESVGLRTTSIRDARGVLWHIRNGEIVRVGNKSQGWAMVVLDMPIGFANLEEATTVLEHAAQTMAAEDEWREKLMSPPQILGVEQMTVDGATIRITAKTTTDAQPVVARELRTRLADALAASGISGAISANRVYVRPPTEEPPSSATSGL
jgi:small conductance mechanosensitive channel